MFKKFLGIIIISSFILTVGFIKAEQSQPLSQSVLRLHVIANSDDPGDQALKLQVKDEIVKFMGQDFININNAAQAREIAVKKTPLIKARAESIIKDKGYNYPVKVYVGEYEFPTKSYGNIIFPQGEYQAVRVVIGEGQGKNWWCVLFPPLCMVSSSDRGISFNTPQEAQVSLKCLELLQKGVKLSCFVFSK